MTKKDFELIAQSITNVRSNYAGVCPNTAKLELDAVSVELARQLVWNNPRFDKARFLAACGVK